MTADEKQAARSVRPKGISARQWVKLRKALQRIERHEARK